MCGSSESTFIERDVVDNSCGASKRKLSEVMLMLYPVMIPFLSDGGGRSQTRVKLLERTSFVVKLSGGPLGTVQRAHMF